LSQAPPGRDRAREKSCHREGVEGGRPTPSLSERPEQHAKERVQQILERDRDLKADRDWISKWIFEVPDVPAPGLVVVATGDWQP